MLRITFIFTLCLCGSFPLASRAEEMVAKSSGQENSEKKLFKGIDLFEEGKLDEAMETLMEVLRMGATADEKATAKDYLDRITRSLGGISDAKPPQSIKTKASPAAAPSPRAKETNGEYLPAVKQSITERPEKFKGQWELSTPVPGGPVPETLSEYVERKLKEGRLIAINWLKAKEGLSVLLKGSDRN